MKDSKMENDEVENPNNQASEPGMSDVVRSPEEPAGAISSIEKGEITNSPSTDGTEIDWKLLPPLPTPNEVKHKEYQCGASILGGAAALCFVAIQSAYGAIDTQHNLVSTIVVAAISFLFLTEMVCLLAIYHKDPGVVKRSESTCYPIPPQVQPYIRSYIEKQRQSQQVQSDRNNSAPAEERMPSELYITMEADENDVAENDAVDTYCVRCLVWRKGKKKYFHCNTCQRCVSHYDHHCNVFGRCIAGRVPFQGNLLIFYTAVGASAFLYAITAIGLAWKLGDSGFLS